jgi:hypothetical protein
MDLLALAMLPFTIGFVASYFLLFRIWRSNPLWAEKHNIQPPRFQNFKISQQVAYQLAILQFNRFLRQNLLDCILLVVSWISFVSGYLLFICGVLMGFFNAPTAEKGAVTEKSTYISVALVIVLIGLVVLLVVADLGNKGARGYWWGKGKWVERSRFGSFAWYFFLISLFGVITFQELTNIKLAVLGVIIPGLALVNAIFAANRDIDKNAP